MRPLLIALMVLFWLGRGLAQETTPPLGTVSGQLQLPGVERYSGVVSLWDAERIPMPDPRRYILIPSQAGPVEADGRFLLRVPAGRYYLGAILRQTPGPAMGPPRPGDRVLMTPDVKGDELVVEVTAGGVVDVGRQGGGWVYEGFRDEEVTGISGLLTDVAGAPQAGLLVFAFLDPGMSEQPLAVSARSGADGRYLLRLPGGGQVYLRVRDNYGGGAPNGGGVIGVYGEGNPRPVAVVGGKVAEGIDIVARVLPAVRPNNRDGFELPKGPDRGQIPQRLIDPKP